LATPLGEGATPLTGHPLATPHRERGHFPAPLGRRAFAHWPPLGHTLRDGAATWPKGSRPLPLPGLREPHHARPPTGQTGRPTLATLPPFGRPIGAYGHRLPHWPPTGHLLAIREAPPTGQKGRPRLATGRGSLRPALPRLAKGAGGGAFGHTGAPAPHFPATGRGGVFRVQRGAMRCCPCA